MEKLIAIYKHRTQLSDVSDLEGGFYLINILSSTGPLKRDFIEKIYSEFFVARSKTKDIGPFDSLEELSKFCFKICDELKLPFITLHSLEEFNTVVEESSNLTELLSGLKNGGNLLENVSVSQKKSFFDRVLHRS
jgi:hypothetical protein